GSRRVAEHSQARGVLWKVTSTVVFPSALRLCQFLQSRSSPDYLVSRRPLVLSRAGRIHSVRSNMLNGETAPELIIVPKSQMNSTKALLEILLRKGYTSWLPEVGRAEVKLKVPHSNAKFNKKAERFYEKSTAEINLERGNSC
ncbi:hypothetical protein M91_13379, partial [Bos mutus]